MMTAPVPGAPRDPSGRGERERAVYRFLDSLGISYCRLDHPAAATMEDCAAIEAVLGRPIVKNLFLTNRQHTAYYLLLLRGDKPFRTKDLSAQIGSARLSFASAEEMERLLGTTPGSASILGLMHDREGEVTLLVDRDILSLSEIGVHPLVNTATLGISVNDLLGTFLPAVCHTHLPVVL